MPVVRNRVRSGFYMDSVALMRLSRTLAGLPGVENAALMIGSPSNRALLEDSALLTDDGRAAGPNDVILAIAAESEAAAEAALAQAEELISAPRARPFGPSVWRPKSLAGAVESLSGANLALISVPGDFAALEAHRALRRNLHVMMFSDNVTLAEERSLKKEALRRGRLFMGPDCGTAILNGTPLAFANAVPRGTIGLIAASGTGLQEVTTLIARHGGGISQAIGVGSRDLHAEIGGITTLMALDLLDEDPETERIVIISKPPDDAVAQTILHRAGQIQKPVTLCLLGLDDVRTPGNVTAASTLKAAAEHALGGVEIGAGFSEDGLPRPVEVSRRWVHGLFTGGTLCAEAQLVFQAADLEVASNAPVPGARDAFASRYTGHMFLDLGADDRTRGQPHPMIDPSFRLELLEKTLADDEVNCILLDLVIGFGAHNDPAGGIAATIQAAGAQRPLMVASVCGTDQDPQNYAAQVAALRGAGVLVAPCNAQAASLACAIAQKVAA